MPLDAVGSMQLAWSLHCTARRRDESAAADTHRMYTELLESTLPTQAGPAEVVHWWKEFLCMDATLHLCDLAACEAVCERIAHMGFVEEELWRPHEDVRAAEFDPARHFGIFVGCPTPLVHLQAVSERGLEVAAASRGVAVLRAASPASRICCGR